MHQIVMVVEDDPGLQMIYKRILSDMDMEVVQAQSGHEAIMILEDGLHPDIMFLDMLLPGTNGVAVIDFIKANPHLHDTYVFVVSSNLKFSRYINEIPNAEFILKPIRPQTIRDLLS